MLAKLSGKLREYAKDWLVLVLLVLDMLFNALVLPGTLARMEDVSGGTGPLDLEFFGYSAEKAYRMIESYGEAGRAAYRTFELTGDIAYPIVYTLFFSLAITWLFQRGFAPDNSMQRLNVMPFGAWLFDLFENLGIVAMLSVFPATPALLAQVTSVFSVIKWLFAAVSIVLTLVGLVMALKNRFKRQDEMA